MLMIFMIVTKISPMTKLDKNVALLENTMGKLRLWLNFSAAQQCNGNEFCGNFTPTRLFIQCCRCEDESSSRPYPLNNHPHSLNGGPRCVQDESADRAYRCMVGPPHTRIILIVSRQRAQGRCFSDLQHSEA
jgi:hypothetical protein